MLAEYMSKLKRLSQVVQRWLYQYLVIKAPYQIPANVKEWIVVYVPWIDLILLVLLVPVLLTLLGVGTFLLPLSLAGGYHLTFGLLLILIILLLQLGLMVAALPGLLTRQLRSWEFLFYGLLLNIVYNLLQLELLSCFLVAAVGGYVLLQIRPYYKRQNEIKKGLRT